MSDTKDETTAAPDVVKALQGAVKGLRWPSESDKPVKVFHWEGSGAADEATLRAAAKLAGDATIQPVLVDELFGPLTAQQDWFGDEEKANAARFQALHDTLTNALKEVSAFRVANNHSDRSLVDVYIVGCTSGGDLAGVATQLVET